jgi:hypothetical protein
LPLPENRKKSIAHFIQKVENYDRKDILLRASASVKQLAYFYYLTPPPYKDRPPKIGWGHGFHTKALLTTDFFLFLTRWTPDKKHRKSLAKYFAKELAADFFSSYLSDVSYGLSDMAVGIGERLFSASKPGEAMVELANPWSVILPIDDITACERISFGFLNLDSVVQIKADHRYEGTREWYFVIGLETGQFRRKISQMLESR